MASKTLLQTRTDYPAVTPIDPDECLILDQQTDQPEGEQSTVATLSELIATGGRMVETDEAYETLYADSVVNVSASSITITVGSAMRNGSRLLIRRTSAYDGDSVTITPPSGATFEDKASLSLYGQYSFVEIERISSTVFAIREWEDRFAFTPTFSFSTSNTGITYINQVGLLVRNKNNMFVSVDVTGRAGTSVGNLSIIVPTLAASLVAPRLIITSVGISLTPNDIVRVVPESGAFSVLKLPSGNVTHADISGDFAVRGVVSYPL